MTSEQTKTETNATTYNRWQRFVNWLAGGPPDPQKIAAAQKKSPTWYRRYALSLSWLLMTSGGMIYPLIISRLNSMPELDRMQTMQLRIVQTREGDPHFDMQLPDGTVQVMEWPVKLRFRRGERVYYWTKAQRQALVGCNAKAQVALIRWTFTDRYRVWSLSCPDVNFEVGINETTLDLKESATSVTSLVIGLLVLVFPLWIVFFLREKRGVL